MSAKSTLVLDLHTPEGWKSKLTTLVLAYQDGLTIHSQLLIHLLTS